MARIKLTSDFKHGLLVKDIAIIAKNINMFVNSDAGIRTFDVALHTAHGKTKKAELAEATLKKIVAHPSWDPNYRAPDMWHPEERAMLHHREDIAIAVIKHPNFDKARLPQVVVAAQQFKAKKVLAFLKKQHVRG